MTEQPSPDPLARDDVAVVLPLKPLAIAKSRLDGVPPPRRQELVLAFAVDTVAALKQVVPAQRILVITDDFAAARRLGESGCVVLPDGVTEGLNESLRLGAAEMNRRFPGTGLLGLLPDLPCLNGETVEAFLALACAHSYAFVPDRHDVGVCAMWASSLEEFLPRFGADSRREFLDQGAREVGTTLIRLRLDVDTPSDLREALLLGVGEATRAATLGG